ncbi:MAG: SGNH/GDSL hydrolase family protein [Treponema sp.]|nr:SGNH/GDSL hydrolase family protein [Treponema sp.]
MKKIFFTLALICICLPVFAAGDNFMNEKSDLRLENFLAKIRRGEDVTVIALGGSITTGFNAKNAASEGWAGLTGAWIKDLASKSGSKVTFYNQGVSGTDSAFAIARLDDHVISLNPDLLLLEYAMNDQWLDAKVRNRTYESIVRKVLSKGDTAILALFVNERKAPYPSAQAVEKPICDYYHIPYVSWKECLEKTSKLSDFEKFYDGEETIHPNSTGHANIASHIENKIKAVWDNLPADSEIPSPVKELPKALSDCGFENAKYYTSDNIEPVSNTGWQATSPVHNEWVSHGKAHKGWQTNDPDAELTFEVEGSSVGITYCESDQFRNAQAWVTKEDGTSSPKVNLMCLVTYRKGYYGWAYRELIDTDKVQKFTVHIAVSKRAPKTAQGKNCNITGILVAGEK